MGKGNGSPPAGRPTLNFIESAVWASALTSMEIYLTMTTLAVTCPAPTDVIILVQLPRRLVTLIKLCLLTQREIKLF